MGFTSPKIKPGPLTKAEPTQLNTDNLGDQLEKLGLSCAQITKVNLQKYIDKVDTRLPNGKTETFGIKAPKSALAPAGAALQVMAEVEDPTSPAAALPQLVKAATGNWTINNEAEGYGPNLEIIQYSTHFDWLYDNRATNGFTGQKDSPPARTGNFTNAQAIMDLFVAVGESASSAVAKGLDKASLRAALTNAIQGLKDANLTNYVVPQPGQDRPSRVWFLVDNYDPNTGNAEGIGVLSVDWSLSIQDYQKSSDDPVKHKTNLSIRARGVEYSDPNTLCAHYNQVLEHFGINKSTAPSCRTA